MNKKRHNRELDVDFIGGEELTEREKSLLKDYFSAKKKRLGKTTRLGKSKAKEKVR